MVKDLIRIHLLGSLDTPVAWYLKTVFKVMVYYTRHVTNSKGSHTSEDLHAASKMFPLIPFTHTYTTCV